MTENSPESLSELLKTLERSTELRSLARQCGLSVRELRRRLSIWRRELAVGDEADCDSPREALDETISVPLPAPHPENEAKTTRPALSGNKDDVFTSLTPAAELLASPLPTQGKPIMEIFTDGASRGNPGPAAIGIVFGVKGGKLVAEHCEAIGRTTNNVAEYRAVVVALEHCGRWGVQRVHLRLDSELIVRQLHGVYRVKSPDLRPLYQQVVFLSKNLDEFQVEHVKRAFNVHADALANSALDENG